MVVLRLLRIACAPAVRQTNMQSMRECSHRRSRRQGAHRIGQGSTSAPVTQPSLAVLVPYRDRAEQLAVFVPHMRQHLAAQGEGRYLYSDRLNLSTFGSCTKTRVNAHRLPQQFFDTPASVLDSAQY